MTQNMGSADKAIRLTIAVAIAILYFTHIISGTLAVVLGAVAVVFVLTSLINVCPLYLPFGISTKKRTKS